jgi:hypothetical protein
VIHLPHASDRRRKLVHVLLAQIDSAVATLPIQDRTPERVLEVLHPTGAVGSEISDILLASARWLGWTTVMASGQRLWR